jgi:phosphoribosyl-AMP cyclohydrolase
MNARAETPIRFDRDGLIPVVVQDSATNGVLMLAFMNAEALRLTRETGRAHYWSRDRSKLWRKGETSGHEQFVDAILVNCEHNSLLIKVRQVGAVCHEGYPTCYFRELLPDDGLPVVVERWFDPAEVYRNEPFEAATRQWYGAYESLRDHDLTAVSSTSRLLRIEPAKLPFRAADELRELAGALRGTHRHASLESDVVLEAGQCLYWLALIAVAGEAAWDQVRPDRALITTEAALPAASAARLLESDASAWASGTPPTQLAPRVHASMALVAQACRSTGVSPLDILRTDLDELRSRPYLNGHFG